MNNLPEKADREVYSDSGSQPAYRRYLGVNSDTLCSISASELTRKMTVELKLPIIAIRAIRYERNMLRAKRRIDNHRRVPSGDFRDAKGLTRVNVRVDVDLSDQELFLMTAAELKSHIMIVGATEERLDTLLKEQNRLKRRAYGYKMREARASRWTPQILPCQWISMLAKYPHLRLESMEWAKKNWVEFKLWISLYGFNEEQADELKSRRRRHLVEVYFRSNFAADKTEKELDIAVKDFINSGKWKTSEYVANFESNFVDG